MKTSRILHSAFVIAAILASSTVLAGNNSSASALRSPGQTGLAEVCGSGISISAALDDCGRAGYKFAHCTKKGSNWTCEPTADKTRPGVRATGIKPKLKK